MPFRSSARGSFGPQAPRLIKGPRPPVWATFSPPNAGAGAYSYQFVATDDSGDAPTYSVASGSLPNGLTLSSSGLLSGTPTLSGTFTFNVRATDVNGYTADTGNLSVTITLFSYATAVTNITFTPVKTGPSGPSLSEAKNMVTEASKSSWIDNTAFFNVDGNGRIIWQVPSTGTWRIEARGAKGNDFSRSGGNGATIRGDLSLTGGEILYLVVGQSGTNNGAGGGGGGTFAVRSPYNTNGSILVIAGGGGGSGADCCGSQSNGSPGQAGNNGTDAQGSGITAGGTGGSGGNGGTGINAGGGGGFFTNGNGGTGPGFAFVNGGAGGSPNGGYGGGSQGNNPGGAGGGYSGGGGGAGGAQWAAGGGGGSYNNGSSQVNTTGGNGGAGYLNFTKL